MKELKFRCWDKNHNKMRGVKDIKWFDNGNIRINATESDKNYEPLMYMKEYEGKELKEFELMQYTGMNERTENFQINKEIYEGDVVRCYGGEYCQGFYEFNETIIVKDLFTDCFMMGESEYLKVLGNIYENPELLKEG